MAPQLAYKIGANCLSVAKIQAEVRKRSKKQSAFSFEAFATSTFEEVEEEEKVAAPDTITHAATQVQLRTLLVQQMTNEVRSQSEAALSAARLEDGQPATGKHEPAAPVDAGAPAVVHDAREVELAWREAIVRLAAWSRGPADPSKRPSLQLDAFLSSIQLQHGTCAGAATQDAGADERAPPLTAMPEDPLDTLVAWEHCTESADVPEEALGEHAWLEMWPTELLPCAAADADARFAAGAHGHGDARVPPLPLPRPPHEEQLAAERGDVAEVRGGAAMPGEAEAGQKADEPADGGRSPSRPVASSPPPSKEKAGRAAQHPGRAAAAENAWSDDRRPPPRPEPDPCMCRVADACCARRPATLRPRS
jgi:hypothetical protein